MRATTPQPVWYCLGKRWLPDEYGIWHPFPLAFEVPPSNHATAEVQVGYVATRVMFRGVNAIVDADPGDENP